MDIAAEKADIIRRFSLVNDIDLIQAIKQLLDLGLNENGDKEFALKASIARAINDSKKGFVRPYDEFMLEVRKRYEA